MDNRGTGKIVLWTAWLGLGGSKSVMAPTCSLCLLEEKEHEAW